MRRNPLVAIVLLLALCLIAGALAGCGGDEGESDTADDTSADSDDGDDGGPLTLSSPAFDEGDPIPPEYSLGGGDISPPLSWSGVPPDTTELALTVVDPDAGNFVHWVVAAIDPERTAIEQGVLPDGAVQALNNFGEASWGGPAPPPGAPHTYVFTLYALTEPSGIAEASSGNDAIAALEGSGAPTAVLRATFEQR